jgi:hypothetical protein
MAEVNNLVENKIWPYLVTPKIQKLFKILHHIESLDVYMEH